MFEPLVYDTKIRQQRDFKEIFLFENDDATPTNLSGWTVKSQIRRSQSTSAQLIGEFHSEIVMEETATKVIIYLNEIETAALNVGNFYYDIVLADQAGDDATYVEGRVLIVGSVTEWEDDI